MKKASAFFLILTSLAGLVILSPYADVHPALSTGDNGRDFYAFQQTAAGAVPYKDYWWVYGPAMPYYYALFFKIFGGDMASILLGELFLSFLSGILTFLIISRRTLPAFAALGAVWFWTFQPDFTYTFNHTGAVTLLLAAMYFLVRFDDGKSLRDLSFALAAAVLCAFVKLNIGLAVFAGITGCSWWLSREKSSGEEGKARKLLLYNMFLAPLIIVGGYAVFLWGLSATEIRQCLPFLGADRPVHIPFPELAAGYFKAIFRNILSSTTNLAFAALISLCLLKLVLSRSRGEKTPGDGRLFRTLAFVFVFLVLVFHEYLLSGVAYRTFWSFPLTNLIIFLLIGAALRDLAGIIRVALFIPLALIVAVESARIRQAVERLHNPAQHLSFENGEIYTSNTVKWHETVGNAVRYLRKNLDAGETFFALPYDVLYYYLAGKQSPTRMTIFFEHIHITPRQEREIISDLQKNNTAYVILSSRSRSSQKWLGNFGEDYTPLLYKYIRENYTPVATFGDWGVEAGAIEPHAVKILKRR